MSKAVAERVVKVLENIRVAVEKGDEDDVLVWADALDSMLDELGADDYFGTEGQNDPRGDFRNGTWSCMDQVEKVR